MRVFRQIGRHEVLVDDSAPCDIWLEAGLFTSEHHLSARSLAKKEILRLLASEDEYLPLSVQWELTDRCNLACPFCYIVGHSNERCARFTEIEEQLGDLISAGLLFCTLTGGEATIHPDFCAIYQHLKERGVIVDVFSNALSLRQEHFDLFEKYPPRRVEVSLYSLDDDRLREVYRARKAHAATSVLRNILRLRARQISVVCKCFVNTLTVNEMERISSWCRVNDLPFYASRDVRQAYDGVDLSRFGVGRQSRMLPIAEVPQGAIAIPCGTRNFGAAINPAFEIFPCPATRLSDCTYDLRALGVQESLRRMKTFVRRFQDEKIVEVGSSIRRASCMANAEPMRDDAGALTGFAHPAMTPRGLSA